MVFRGVHSGGGGVDERLRSVVGERKASFVSGACWNSYCISSLVGVGICGPRTQTQTHLRLLLSSVENACACHTYSSAPTNTGKKGGNMENGGRQLSVVGRILVNRCAAFSLTKINYLHSSWSTVGIN